MLELEERFCEEMCEMNVDHYFEQEYEQLFYAIEVYKGVKEEFFLNVI